MYYCFESNSIPLAKNTLKNLPWNIAIYNRILMIGYKANIHKPYSVNAIILLGVKFLLWLKSPLTVPILSYVTNLVFLAVYKRI